MMLVQQTNIYSIMSETYIAMDEVLDRIRSHPDVKLTTKSLTMLKQLGDRQDLLRKPRQHIIKSKLNKAQKTF